MRVLHTCGRGLRRKLVGLALPVYMMQLEYCALGLQQKEKVLGLHFCCYSGLHKNSVRLLCIFWYSGDISQSLDRAELGEAEQKRLRLLVPFHSSSIVVTAVLQRKSSAEVCPRTAGNGK